MTKPSEIPSKWTLERAWRESAIRHYAAWAERGGSPILPFPADPVERVSDEDVAFYVKHGADIPRMLAIEVLASRAKDKGGKS